MSDIEPPDCHVGREGFTRLLSKPAIVPITGRHDVTSRISYRCSCGGPDSRLAGADQATSIAAPAPLHHRPTWRWHCVAKKRLAELPPAESLPPGCHAQHHV